MTTFLHMELDSRHEDVRAIEDDMHVAIVNRTTPDDN